MRDSLLEQMESLHEQLEQTGRKISKRRAEYMWCRLAYRHLYSLFFHQRVTRV